MKEEWIEFLYHYDKDGNMVFDCQMPEYLQSILITVNLKGHEPVQADIFMDDGVEQWLISGYAIGTDAIAWMPFPEPFIPFGEKYERKNN